MKLLEKIAVINYSHYLKQIVHMKDFSMLKGNWDRVCPNQASTHDRVL